MRTVLYLRLPHFLTRVERLLHPEWAGEPLMVGIGSYHHGTIRDASPEAAAAGVVPGLSWRRARRRCPEARLIPYDRERYAAIEERVGDINARYTPWGERFSTRSGGEGEFFLDLGRVEPEEAVELAISLRGRLARELDLKAGCSLGSGKLVARAASRAHRQAALEGRPPLVPRGRERVFLAPLPVEHLWGMKSVHRERLHLLGLRTLGQLAGLAPRAVMQMLGREGRWHWQLARGVDRRPVGVWQPSPAESAAGFLDHDLPDQSACQMLLQRLTGRLAERLSHSGREARRVSLTAHLSGNQRLFVTRHLKQTTRAAADLHRAGCALLEQLEPRLNEALTAPATPAPEMALDEARALLLGEAQPNYGAAAVPHPRLEVLEVSAGGLQARQDVQLLLFGQGNRTPALRRALEEITTRFGEKALANAGG